MKSLVTEKSVTKRAAYAGCLHWVGRAAFELHPVFDALITDWATIASLIETCKLNAVDPQDYLTRTLTAIVNGHRQSQIEELMPWNYSRRSNG